MRLHRASHNISALRQHTRLNDVRRGLPSSPLSSTHSRTTSGVAFHHSPWVANNVERCRAWPYIIALGLHARSNDVGRDMPSPPLDSTLGRTTFGVACYHRGWAAHTIERRRAWHDITSLGMHEWSDDVGRGITSPPLDSTLGRQRRAWHEITAFGQHTWSNDIGHGIPSSPLGSTHGQTMLGMA